MDTVTEVKTQYRKEQWMRLIKECQASGLTIRAWCAQNNISENAYYYWLRRIRRSECDKLLPAAKDKPLDTVVFAPLLAEKYTGLRQGPVIIHMLNTGIEVRDDSSPNALKIALSALKELC